jgi:hypothetical protein
MAQNTRPARRPPRFGRTTSSPSARRFARQGAGTTSGRFARPGTSASRPRGTSPQARSSSRPRSPFARLSGRKSEQKGLAGTVAGMLPTGAAAKATPSSKKGKVGGLLALAAAAGVAFRNRDKLTAMAGRGRGSEPGEEPVAGPAHNAATTVPPPGNAPGSVPRAEGGVPNAQLREL